MKTSCRTTWHRSVFRTAVVAGVGMVFASIVARVAPAATCSVGDCNNDMQVTVDEIVTMVNIALGNQVLSTCTAGDSNHDTMITVDEIVSAVNLALNGCGTGPTPTPTIGGVCGDGAVNAGEECDDGGTCTGGSNAGTACTKESDCMGQGVCVGGSKTGTACDNDAGCTGVGSSKCVHCKTFGGDGCAANCTMEHDVMFNLKPGVVVGGVDIQTGTSGAVVHGDVLPKVPLPLTGAQTFTIGKMRDGQITGIIKAASVQFPAIPVSTLACACVRGVAAKSCGGTLFESDGTTRTVDCTPEFTAGDSLCAGGKPCAFIHGPGNTSSGVVGCTSLQPVDLTFTQDCNGTTGELPGSPVIALSGSGGPGSAVLISNLAIGTVVGSCTGTTAAYGGDGLFCTSDDPQSSRGAANPLVSTTSTVTATVKNANDVQDFDIGPFTTTGVPFSCTALDSGSAVGANLAAAFTSCDQPTVGDIVVTNNFVAE